MFKGGCMQVTTHVVHQVDLHEAHRSWLEVAVGALQGSTNITTYVHNHAKQ